MIGDVADKEKIFFLTDEHHPIEGGSTMLGFWIYLMSDCLIFAALFAVYAVLGGNLAGGPGPRQLFDLPIVAVNTSLLLLSSLTFGFSILAADETRVRATKNWLWITGLMGLAFVGVELSEFRHMLSLGAVPSRSAFLSSFFTLVGTHGLHVAFGIVWLLTLLVQISIHGLTEANRRRLACLSMFWHFLDVIWIAVFTFVYLVRMVP